jgi:hypothetical protein
VWRGSTGIALQRVALRNAEGRFTIRHARIVALRYQTTAQGFTFAAGVASGVQASIIHSTIP